MTMKENQNETSFDSRSFGRETDPLTFGNKERYELNDSRMDADFTELEAKDRDNCSNFKVMDDSSFEDENGMMDSPRKEGQNGLSNHLIMDNGIVDLPRKESNDGLAHHLSSWDKDADSLSSDSYDMEKEQGSPGRESFDTVEELAVCNKSNPKDSSSPLFTDKNVLECDLPELEVCYRETDCQILKDICVDEGKPEKDVNSFESCSFPLPRNDIDHLEAKKEPSSDADSFTTEQCVSKEENEGNNLISREKLDPCLENSFDRDTIKHCKPETEAEKSEACFDGTGKADIDSSEDSPVDRKLPIEDFGYQNSHGLDGGNEVMQLPDQVLNQEAVSGSPASSAEADGTEKDVQSSCLAYNRKVENEIIIFNFSSPDGVVGGNNDMAGDVKEQSADSGDVVHKDVNAENLPAATSNEVDDSNKQSLRSNEGNSDDGSATSHIQCITSEGSSCGNVYEGSSEHKQANSEDISIDDHVPVQSPSTKSPVATSDPHASEPNAPNHDGKDSDDVPVANQLQQDMGETSFSAASMITYSGPIAFSGSLSHRSDGSTTSGKSFAFPVLQSEWNSSPVRMAKADRRDFRKHKGWRSGLLCCRF